MTTPAHLVLEDGSAYRGLARTAIGVIGDKRIPANRRLRGAEMRANKLIEKAQLVVDSKGKKSAVQLDYSTWEELLALLENLEDLEEIDRARRSGEKYVPWEQSKGSLKPTASEGGLRRPFGLCAGDFTVPDDFDDPLPEHLIEEFKG